MKDSELHPLKITAVYQIYLLSRNVELKMNDLRKGVIIYMRVSLV